MLTYNIQSTPQDGNQPIDFTSKSDNTSPSVLDLSCKKQDKREICDDLNLSNCNPMSSEASSFTSMREATTTTTDDHHLNQSHQITCGNESQSPSEFRTFMITPPSDRDSPNKQKFYSMYPQYNLSGAENSVYPVLPFGQPGFPVSTMLANVMANDNLSQFHIPTSLGAHNSVSQCQSNIPKSLVSSGIIKKAPRPFKAYPKNPFAMLMNSPDMLEDVFSNEKYNEFRNTMLESVKKTNKTTNIKMRRSRSPSAIPTSTDDTKSSAYWERRRKNNEAAKRSRDARRAKEDEIAIRAAFLEGENRDLKCEVMTLKNELAKLHSLISAK